MEVPPAAPVHMRRDAPPSRLSDHPVYVLPSAGSSEHGGTKSGVQDAPMPMDAPLPWAPPMLMPPLDNSRPSSTSTSESLSEPPSRPMSTTSAVHLVDAPPSWSPPRDARSLAASPLPQPESPPLASSALAPARGSSETAAPASRLWHAVNELISTEENYVSDLYVLVNVYFVALPTVPFFAESPERLATVRRNAPELLVLHTELHKAMLGVAATHLSSPQSDAAAAAGALAQLFVSMAPRFHIYHEFCAKHKEALALLDELEGRPDWDLFQARRATAARLAQAATSHNPAPLPDTQSPPTPSAAANAVRRRLVFRDFFIKPVQRVCLYPIVLQHLQKLAPPSQHAALGAATELMRQLLAETNEASATRASLLLTDMIVSRMDPSSLALPATLWPVLGGCQLAGSLDVLYHHPTQAPLTTPLAIKYYGCFLFRDFFLMVRVRKNHLYVPKFWFPLHEATLSRGDASDGQLHLPYSFRLSVRGHHFELIGTTAKERLLWLDAVEAALQRGPARTRPLHGGEVPFPCNLEATTDVAPPTERGEQVDPLTQYLSSLRLNETAEPAAPAAAAVPTTTVLLRHKSPLRRAAKDRDMVFSEACRSARTSLEGDAARPLGTLVSSRMSMQRLSGNETLSLQLTPSDALSVSTDAALAAAAAAGDDVTWLQRSSSARRRPSLSLSRRASQTLLAPLRSSVNVLGSSGAATPTATSRRLSWRAPSTDLSMSVPPSGTTSPTADATSSGTVTPDQPLRRSASTSLSPLRSWASATRRKSVDLALSMSASRSLSRRSSLLADDSPLTSPTAAQAPAPAAPAPVSRMLPAPDAQLTEEPGEIWSSSDDPPPLSQSAPSSRPGSPQRRLARRFWQQHRMSEYED